MKLHNPGIQKRLVVPVQGQMPLVPPVPKLVNDAVKQLFVHPFIGTFFRILIGCAERTGAVAPVNCFQIYHQRHRRLFLIKKMLNVSFLQFISGKKLKL